MSRDFTRDNRASRGGAIRNKVPGRERTWVKKCMERWQMTEEMISKTATLRRSLFYVGFTGHSQHPWVLD